MYIIYNDNIIHESTLNLSTDNRAFLYGDGIFETIIYQGGKLNFAQFHKERLTKAMAALSLEFQKNTTLDTIFEHIDQLMIKGGYNSGRLRLQVWRSAGGLYTPTNQSSNVMVTNNVLHKNPITSKANVNFSNSVTLTNSKWSSFKTISAIPYISAGLEKTQRKLDDLILLDNNSYLSECTSSNLFWKKNNTYFTPSLDCGCIDGIMRRHIIEILKQQNVDIQIGKYHKDELIEADEVFTTNVTGVVPILSIDKYKFSSDLSITPLLAL